MIVIDKNGERRVITGWREWLLWAGAFVAAWLVLALVAFLLLGMAITASAVLVILLPAAVIGILIASLFRRAR